MSDLTKTPPPKARFQSTSWTVLGKARAGSGAESQAWEHIYEVYYRPVMAFLELRGQAPHEAEETAQRFFAWLWEKNVVARAEQARGRFRTFLLAALKQFVQREHRHRTALKRSLPPGAVTIAAGEEHSAEIADPRATSPERSFDRTCAMELLRQAFERVRDEYERNGQGQRFAALSGLLTGDSETSVEAVAQRLGISKNLVHLTAHRLRQRYGQVLCDLVAATVTDQGDVKDEIRALFRAVRAG